MISCINRISCVIDVRCTRYWFTYILCLPTVQVELTLVREATRHAYSWASTISVVNVYAIMSLLCCVPLCNIVDIVPTWKGIPDRVRVHAVQGTVLLGQLTITHHWYVYLSYVSIQEYIIIINPTKSEMHTVLMVKDYSGGLLVVYTCMRHPVYRK